MTYKPELSLRSNCNPRLFESYFIPVFKENNFHSKIELGMFTLDRWSVPVSDTVNPRAKLRSCWSQGTHPIKARETKAPVLIYRLAVGGGRLGNFGPVTLLDAFPLIRLSMISYPDLSRSTGWAVFFCLEGVSLFHCSRGLRSLFVYWDWALRGRIRRRIRLWGSFVNHLRKNCWKESRGWYERKRNKFTIKPKLVVTYLVCTGKKNNTNCR